MGVVVVLALSEFVYSSDAVPVRAWVELATYVSLFGIFGALARVLGSKRRLSLPQLRWTELIFLGTVVAFFTGLHGYLYPRLQVPNPPIWYGGILANAICLPWALVIVAAQVPGQGSQAAVP